LLYVRVGDDSDSSSDENMGGGISNLTGGQRNERGMSNGQVNMKMNLLKSLNLVLVVGNNSEGMRGKKDWQVM
jgi:hypothetical protein